MKKILFAALLALLPCFAFAQTVVQQPQFVAPHAVLDLGNGPTEVQLLTGNGGVFASLGSAISSTSGSSTTLTLTATPAIPPCVGCLISGAGITSGTTVTAFNGTTTVTLSAAMTVAASTPVAYGAACPVSTQTAPVQPTVPMALLQAAVAPAQTGLYLYTQARICVWGGNAPGMQFVTFAPGAH